MRYFGKIKTYGEHADLSSYGSRGIAWIGKKDSGRRKKVPLHLMNFEDLYDKAVKVKRSFPKKLRKFDETIQCNEGEYRDYGVYDNPNAKCRTKMLTVTFQEDIQKKGRAYIEFDRVLKSVEKKIAEYFNLDKYKVHGIGVYERHHENRTGFHIHLIAFNIPYMNKPFYRELKRYTQESLRASIRIDSPKTKFTYDENRIVVDSYESMRTYLSKTFNYVKKQFNFEMDWLNEDGKILKPEYLDIDPFEKMCLREELIEILGDLTSGKTFVKRGRLFKPKEEKFFTYEEFQHYRDFLIESETYKVQQVFMSSGFIPIDLIKFIKGSVLPAINRKFLEFMSREYVGMQCKYTDRFTNEVSPEVMGYVLKIE